jgi:hypothetical protein
MHRGHAAHPRVRTAILGLRLATRGHLGLGKLVDPYAQSWRRRLLGALLILTIVGDRIVYDAGALRSTLRE